MARVLVGRVGESGDAEAADAVEDRNDDVAVDDDDDDDGNEGATASTV